MSTAFYVPKNNATGTVASAYTAGSGTLTLVDASSFPSVGPFRLTLYTGQGNTLSIKSILAIASRSGNTLTISEAIEGTTDTSVPAGTLAACLITAGALSDVQTAINNLENGVVHLAGAETITGQKTFSTTIIGSISGSAATAGSAGTATTAGSITGAISEAQVTGLSGSLALLAPLASPSFTGSVTIGSLSGILKASSGVISTATSGTDYLVPTGSGAALTGITGSQISGNIAGNSASITGSITQSQVTGLSTSLASLSPLAGSTSLTTTGTISAGTWHASAIGVTYLGSGTPAAGKYLDGAGSWTTLPTGSGSPGGSNGQIQYNSSGSFAGSANLTTSSGSVITTTSPTSSTTTHFSSVDASGNQLLKIYDWGSAGPATWIELPTSGPSGIGTGSPGSNPWIAYVNMGGNWFYDGAAGDVAYRNQGGAMLFGNDSTFSVMQVKSNAVGFTAHTATTIPVKIQAATSQTADLLQVQNASGSTLAGVDPNGYLRTATTSGSPSTSPAAGSMAYDQSTNKLWIYNGSAWKSVTLT